MDLLEKMDKIRDKVRILLNNPILFTADVKSDHLLIAIQKANLKDEWFKKYVYEYKRFEIIRRRDNQYFPIGVSESIVDLPEKNIDFIGRLLHCL